MRFSALLTAFLNARGSFASLAYGSPVSVAHIFDPTRISFVTVGDSGRVGPDLLATADAVFEIAKRTPISFMAMVGDLSYPYGIESSVEEFSAAFTEPFLGVSVIHPVLGDNDYGEEGHVSDISAFLKVGSADPRWEMPNLYYSKMYKQGAISICSLFLDTQSLVSIPFAELRHVDEISFLGAQLEWMEGVLGSPECQASNFILVFGHHPVYSVSKKGNKGVVGERIRSALLPLLTQYHVDAYFSGHDHDLQALHAKEGHHIMSYIVSGASSRLRSSVKHEEHEHLHSWSVKDIIGFSVSEVTENNMTTSFIASKTGEVIHRHLTRSHKHIRMHESASITPSLLAKSV